MFSNKSKLESRVLIVVNDWDLKGHLIDQNSAGKMYSIQNTS